MTKPVAWSYSALNSFLTCPRKHYETKVVKNYPDEMGEAGLWGDYVHRMLDARIGNKTPLPEKVAQYETLAARFDKMRGEVFSERKITLNKDMEEVAWFAKDAWLRVIIDVSVLNGNKGAAFDWKTGKRKMDIDQLKLFAAVMFTVHPHLEQVQTGYVWLQERKIDKELFYRRDLPELWRHFAPKVTKLVKAHATGSWPEKPSGLCKAWCPVLTCDFNGRRGRSNDS
jgi:hypothetical protein